MPRGDTLLQMLDALRAEAGLASSVATSVNQLPRMTRLLQRTQRRLYDAHDWPFKKITADKLTAAGQRYYDFPANMDPEKVEHVLYKWGTEWVPLARGINTTYYSAFDSDNDSRSDPAQRWEMTSQTGSLQFEIWPIPATNGVLNGNGSLRFEGTKKLAPLVANTDTCEIDSDIIVLFAAAELLAGRDAKDAAAKLQAGKDMMRDIKGDLKGRQQSAVGAGVGGPPPSRRQRKIFVAKASV